MKKKSLKLNYCLYLVVSIFFCGNTLYGQSSYDYKLVKSKADSIFSECEGQPGCAVGIMHQDKLVYQSGYGYANMDLKTPTSPSTVFEIGTLSMHFTAAGIMLLEDAGQLTLEDEIQQYLPEIPRYEEGKITLRHLLTHSSGLRDYIVLLMAAGNPLDTSFDNAKALSSLSKQKALVVAPGSTYRFSQSNYTLLAIIIERISKQSFPQFMREHLFQPAGMSNSLIYSSPNAVVAHRASSYNGQPSNYQRVLSDHFLANGSSRVLTNVNDFVKWNQFLNEKRFDNKSLMSKLSRVTYLNNGREMTYRYGLEGGIFSGHQMIAHNGYGFGFNAMYLHFPDEALSIVAMNSNMNISAPSKAYDLAQSILPTRQSRGTLTSSTEKTIIKLDRNELEKFSGDYFDPRYAYTRRIYVSDDTLRLEINPSAIRTLVPASPTTFTIAHSPADVNIQFDAMDNGMQMSVTVDNGEPSVYQSYIPANYQTNDLAQFGGEFISKELETTYRIQREGMTLSTYVGDRRLVTYTAIMKDNFTSDHDGFITFLRNRKGKITGFLLSDYSLGSISFTKS